MNNVKSLEYVKRDSKVVAKTSHIPYFPLVVEKAKGAIIEDVDGNQFIDFLSSASSLNTGSSNDEIIEALVGQLNKFSQYTSAYAYNVKMVELAEKLVSIVPGDFDKKVAFGLCGSDANDAAIKFSRAYTGRSKIVTFINAYHGSTFGALSLSAVTTKMRSKMGPMLGDIYSFPYSYCYRCPYGKNESDCNVDCLDSLDTALTAILPVEEVAAVIVEPIQGDGGLIPASQKFMNKLYNLCKENGILFISEEVQQGLGRTGKWFSIENFGIVPDGIIMGKSLGAGLPLGAFAARAEIIDALDAPAHLFTNTGNAACCAAAIKNIEIIGRKGFLEEVSDKGRYIMDRFRKIDEKYGIIGDIRGYGMSIAVEIVKDKNSREKDTDGVSKMSYRAYEKGLIMIYLSGNVFRVQPPLTISYDEIDRAFEIIDSVFDEYTRGQISDELIKLSSGWK